MNNYIINESTLVLFSLGEKTKVYEKYVNYVVNKKLITIIDESCKYYGSSLKGRTDATAFLIGVSYKCPIVVSEKKNIIFFPTNSMHNSDCVWVNYQMIDNYYLNDNKLLTVNFKYDKSIELDISSNVFCNQILKSSRLESILRNKH